VRASVWLWIALASVAAFSQTGPNSHEGLTGEQPRILSSSGRIAFGIPMFGFRGNAVCDAAGDLFFNVSSPPDLTGPFLEISLDGKRHTIFEMPTDVSPRGNLVWAVTPDGEFYVLHQDFKVYTLFRFKSDGSIDETTTLGIDPGIKVQWMAVANNGTKFIAGYRSVHDKAGQAMPGFYALLDGSGKVERNMSSDAPAFDLKSAALHPVEGSVVAGEDGRFYILQSADVLVVNQAGDVERDLKFVKPDPEADALRVDYSKGIVSIVLYEAHPKPGEVTGITLQALALDAQTGEQLGYYAFDPQETGDVVCFNAQDGYSLMAMDGNMAAKDVLPRR
jgi:hypothetical protein